MLIKINSESATEPLTPTEAKNWLKLDSDLTEDDSLIDMLIADARIYVEGYSGRAMRTKNVTVRRDNLHYDDSIRLNFVAVAAGLVLKTYLNEVETTVAETVYRLNEFENKLELKAGQSWPSFDFVTVTYDVVDDNTEQTKKIMLEYISSAYDYRKDGKPMNKTRINHALDQIRIWEFL